MLSCFLDLEVFSFDRRPDHPKLRKACDVCQTSHGGAGGVSRPHRHIAVHGDMDMRKRQKKNLPPVTWKTGLRSMEVRLRGARTSHPLTCQGTSHMTKHHPTPCDSWFEPPHNVSRQLCSLGRRSFPNKIRFTGQQIHQVTGSNMLQPPPEKVVRPPKPTPGPPSKRRWLEP